MTLSVNDKLMRLDGRWETNHQAGCNNLYIKPSVVWLEKPIQIKRSIGEVKNETKTDENLKRKTTIQKTIEIDKSCRNNIRLEFTDNERIDNDVISVYINERQMLKKQRISDTALAIDFSIPETETDAIVIISAESYGKMAPCTALMTVITKSHKYKVDLSGTFSNNVAVKFVIKE